MSYPPKKILILGATSGIGWEFASRFVHDGSKVIVVGRRQQMLDEFVKQHGRDRAFAVTFDTSKLEQVPTFAKKIMEQHPDLDTIWYNSGIMNLLDFTKSESFAMEDVTQEMTINYLGMVAVFKEFIPYFLKANEEKTLMLTSSGLAILPFPAGSNYSASKAAMHQFALSLREQLKRTNIQIKEIIPPMVQAGVGINSNLPSSGMPMKEYTEETFKGLIAGRQEIPAGTALKRYKAVEVPRRKLMMEMIGAEKGDYMD